MDVPKARRFVAGLFHTLDTRFEALAFRVTEVLGRWPATVIAAMVILGWFGTGPLFGWSDTWQLLINTPTTIIELFQGLFALAATNRVEARMNTMLDRMSGVLDSIEANTEVLVDQDLC